MDKKTLFRLRELLEIAIEVGTPEAYFGLLEELTKMITLPGDKPEADPDPGHPVNQILALLTEIWKTGSTPSSSLPGTPEQQGLLAKLIAEILAVQRFSLDLSQGNLSSSLIDGGLAGEHLQGLQTALCQLARQTQKIVEGDFSQRLDFMNDFSSSVNTMVQWLDETQGQLKGVAQDLVAINDNLKAEIEKRKHIEAELKHYHELLENLSVTDGLTGIANRRRFDEFLLNEWRRAVRYRTPLSLILLDIDSFKAYNDYYGHLSGDDCLRQVAQCLKETIQRPGDLLARFGGEEFACVLTITQAKGARALADQIAKKIRAMKIPHDASPVADRVTVTIGVVTTFPTAEEQPQDLIRKADELLYEGKRSGRNRIKYWPETKSKA